MIVNDITTPSENLEKTKEKDALTHYAHDMLKQYNPDLQLKDLVLVKGLKGYKENKCRLMVKVNTSQLAEELIHSARQDGVNIRGGKPRFMRQFMRKQYVKAAEMNRSRENGCGYHFAVKYGKWIVRICDESGKILEEIKDQENPSFGADLSREDPPNRRNGSCRNKADKAAKWASETIKEHGLRLLLKKETNLKSLRPFRRVLGLPSLMVYPHL